MTFSIRADRIFQLKNTHVQHRRAFLPRKPEKSHRNATFATIFGNEFAHRLTQKDKKKSLTNKLSNNGQRKANRAALPMFTLRKPRSGRQTLHCRRRFRGCRFLASSEAVGELTSTRQ